jgi:hypothetical protein
MCAHPNGFGIYELFALFVQNVHKLHSKWLTEDLFVFVCIPAITDYASDLGGVFDAQRRSIFCKTNSAPSEFKYN